MNSLETESGEKQNLPIRFVSKIVKGFGRGSADLGIPTANLCEKSTRSSVPYESLPTGIYWGFARIVFDGDDENSQSNNGDEEEFKEVFLAAVSVGYNPFYNNKKKTVEPHLIASPESPRRHLSKSRETMFSDLYGHGIRLSIVKYLRPELPFEGMDKLILAIKNDIKNAEQQSNEVNVSEEMLETTQLEKEWIRSSEDLAD